MLTIAATDVKSQLGEIYDQLQKDSSASIMIERNKKPAAMILAPGIARQAILSAYSTGRFSRSVTMNQLGFTWYGQLLDAMDEDGIARPKISGEAQQRLADTALSLLSGHIKPENIDQ